MFRYVARKKKFRPFFNKDIGSVFLLEFFRTRCYLDFDFLKDRIDIFSFYFFFSCIEGVCQYVTYEMNGVILLCGILKRTYILMWIRSLGKETI